jgi:hypothetical protein
MSLISAPYFELTCNGKIDNIRHPNCPSVSPGGFEKDDVVKRALGLGWQESGNGHRCPGCSYVVAVEPAAVKPERKPRSRGGASSHEDQAQTFVAEQS